MNRTRTGKNVKRLIVWLLMLTMVFSLLPMAAFADEAVEEPVQEPVEEQPAESAPVEPAEPAEPSDEPEAPAEEPAEEPADVIVIDGDELPEDEIATQAITALPNVAAPTLDFSETLRVFHLDCGRKYFSATEINAIIDLLAENNYTHLELAIGNEGLRFLLGDMSVTANGTTYDGEAIKTAIQKYNNDMDGSSENLSESDMNDIFSHAAEKGISIIPLLNSPGHMNAIIAAMEAVGLNNVKYNGSERTIDLTNIEAVEFTQALIEKYAVYFENKGCKLFNIGADEYANDLETNGGFAGLIKGGRYSDFVTYVNNIDNIVKKHGMRAIAFNDGFYYDGNNDAAFNSDIIISYWTTGWDGYSTAKSGTFVAKGHLILNTNDAWYYVLGRRSATNATYSLEKAQNGVNNTKYNVLCGNVSGVDIIGCMLCLWCDSPRAEYNAAEVSNVKGLIETLAANNKDVFKATGGGTTEPDPDPTTPPSPEPDPDPDNTKIINLKVGGSATETVDGDYAGVTTENSNIAKVDPKVSDKPGTGTYTNVPKGAGTFFVSKSSAVTVEPPVTLTFEDAGNGEYYIKKGNDYVYPKWTFDWGSKYSVGSGKKGVVVNTSGKEGGYTISCSYTGSLSGSTYPAYLSYDDNGNLTAQSKSVTLYLYTKTDLEKQTTLTFTGVAPGTTYCTVGETKYKIVVDYKQENISAYVGGTTTVSASGELNTAGLDTKIATVSLSGGVLSVTGVAEGTTYVTVGGTKYTITVTNEDLRTVNPLTLEFWITNNAVEAGGAISKNIEAKDVNSADGVEMSTIAPETGIRNGETGTDNLVYYKSSRLTSDKNQTQNGENRLLEGDDFAYIRYWNGAWSFSSDRKVWKNINSTDQLVAYYFQVTTVTDEVTTQVVDWGEARESYSASQFVLLDFVVKYESGTTSSNGFPTDKTIAFHCDHNDKNGGTQQTTDGKYYRRLGAVRGVETSEYEVYMITLTPSSDIYNKKVASSASAAKSYTYDGTEKVVWVDDEANLGNFDDPSTHYESISGQYNYTVGGDPIISGIEIYDTQAMLVTYYVRAKETPDSLRVVYINGTQPTDELIHSYNIAVKKGTLFGDIKLPETTIDGVTSLTNGKVINSNDKPQYVSSDLTTIPEIQAKYRLANFKCNSVEKSEDGKTVYLYYSFSYTKTFVVDFGLPLIIKPENVNTNLKEANITSVTVNTPTYGNAEVVSNRDVKYSLKKMISGADLVSIEYFGTNLGTQISDSVQYNISIVPASNVYYEDGFAKFTDGAGAASTAKWEKVGNEASANQALEQLGDKENTRYVYGYDPAYENSTMFSMGSAHKVTVKSSMVSSWDSDTSSAWPTASFTFKGTGFDIISLTDGDSGAIIAEVKNNEDKSVNKYIVNNYYGYTLDENGNWVVKENSTDCLYQIPVMKITGLEYAEYTVTIQVFYDKAFDMTGDSGYSFWLDAIRVYDPMGTNIADYSKDNEGYPQYIKLRDQIAASESNVGIETTLFIDGNAEAEVAAYTNYGPNNEVYLANGQAISFKLPVNDKIDKVQIGAKTPNATDTKKANSTLTGEIATATEMYYDITEAAQTGKAVTITNIGDAILSLTNIKITYKEPGNTTELEHLTDSDAEAAVATVRALFAAPVDPEPTEPEQPEEPEKTFEPERFETSWSSNVRKGGRAVLTVKASTDVDAIIVDGVTYTKYFTRTERVGRSWNAQRVTYREFVYMMTVNESGTLTVPVVAVSNEQGESNPYETTLTVKPSSPIRDWIGGLFGRWF